jgi:co-chaperonin GroES (HSP10)
VNTKNKLTIRSLFSTLLALLVAFSCAICAQEPPANASATPRIIGTVTSVSGNSIRLKTDSGTETTVNVQDSTKIVKTAPGQKDLKSASPIQLQDVQAGDRVLARGKAGENNSLDAASIIVMKQGDVTSRQQQEMQDWQRHGAGGIVRSVDAASGNITASTAPGQTLTIQTSPNTQFLRYAPDSVKFSDAKKSSLAEIKPGDQLRVRGSRGADGQQVSADEVISGSFRNIAGTVNSIDTAANTVIVMDLLTKKSATVKITPETQMRKIPAAMAQRIAFFLKRSSGQGSSGAEAAPGNAPGAQANARAGGGAAGGQAGGAPDFQQVIRRMPSATISDLQKGDAVMIVTTAGSPGQEVTALTLLSGVEPILTAAPTQTSANLLSGWSMGGGGEGENQ